MELWAKIRQRGKLRHILKAGVFGWGLFMGLGLSIFHFYGIFRAPDHSIPSAAFTMVFYMLAGIPYGMWHWKYSENRYQEYLKQQSTKPLTPDPVGWICPNCGEEVPKNFAQCWNCETNKPKVY